MNYFSGRFSPYYKQTLDGVLDDCVCCFVNERNWRKSAREMNFVTMWSWPRNGLPQFSERRPFGIPITYFSNFVDMHDAWLCMWNLHNDGKCTSICSQKSRWGHNLRNKTNGMNWTKSIIFSPAVCLPSASTLDYQRRRLYAMPYWKYSLVSILNKAEDFWISNGRSEKRV